MKKWREGNLTDSVRSYMYNMDPPRERVFVAVLHAVGGDWSPPYFLMENGIITDDLAKAGTFSDANAGKAHIAEHLPKNNSWRVAQLSPYGLAVLKCGGLP